MDGLSDDPSSNRWSVADIFYKPYPANHYTHCGIDAALALRSDGLRPQDVSSAHLGVAAATVRTIGEPIDRKRSPRTEYEAQFSGPYVVAAALLGGSGLGLGLADFDDALVDDTARRDLMARITVGPDERCDAVYPNQFPAVLTVRTHAGDELSTAVMTNRGGPQHPLGDAELARKSADNTAGHLEAAEADDVVAAAGLIAGLPDLAPLLGPLRRPLG